MCRSRHSRRVRSIRPTSPASGRSTNNEEDTTAQPPLGDYLGIPFNAAGRLRSDTTAESIWGTPEYQCRPHSAPHQWRGLGGARILKEQDPLTRDVRAYHIQFMRSLDRPVFMDGRPHPPAWAPHTWTGFSTGEWIGNTLKITTTHLKDGYPEARRSADERHVHDDGVPHPSRRHPDDRHVGRRSDLPRRAVRRVDDVHDTTRRRTSRWRRATAPRSPRTAAPIAITSRISCRAQNTALDRVAEERRLDSGRADARRREDALSGVPRRASTGRRTRRR